MSKPFDPNVPEPLAPGQAITRWLHSEATEVQFPGEPRPNPDNVTYEFGLVGARPGQSPAREALERRPAPTDPTLPIGPFANLYVGSWSPNVDFSLFAFVPTLITRTLKCRLAAVESGRARFRIATCGSLRIWLGEALVEHFAPFTQNRETDREIVLDLPAHPTDLTIELEDLHERNTTNYFSVTYLGGVGVAATIDAPDPDKLRRVADTMDALESDRVFYESGPLRLRTEARFDHDLTLEVLDIQQFSRADAHECLDHPPFSITLKAGQTTVSLPEITPLPTGCTQILVRTQCDGITISRKIGTTILARGVPVRGRTIAERKAEILKIAVEDTGCEATVALVHLAAGRLTPKTERILHDALTGIEERRDCSDFTMLPMLRIWRDHRAMLSRALRDRLEAAILGYRYWMAEPGNDAMWFWSENHVLCFHTAQLVAGGLFADRKFPNASKTGAEHAADARRRLHRWFEAIERDGLCEWNSAAYYPIDIFALLSLRDMTDDPALRQKATDVLDRIFVMTGLHMTGGTPAGAQGRCYEKELLSGPVNELGAVAAVAFGGTWFPAYGRAALTLCLSDYTPPEVAGKLASPDRHATVEAHYTQGAGAHGKLSLWKSDGAQLSTVCDHMTGERGSQQHVLDIQLAGHPLARLWINHPGDRKPWSERRPSKLAGNHWLPRIAHHRNRAFAIYDVPDDPRYVPFSQLFAIEEAFDQVEEAGQHRLFRSGEFTVVIWCSAPLIRESSGPYSGAVRRANALRTAWSATLERTATETAFSALVDRVAGLRPVFDERERILRTDAYELRYSGAFLFGGNPIGPIHRTSTPTISIDGAPYHDWRVLSERDGPA
ncbi:hypothetical protein [Bauldia sp.]|uniref:hypothetical protein n=1 Tax=Bauldia sp. TaxID=2575872 RepID=UPI003BA9AD4D